MNNLRLVIIFGLLLLAFSCSSASSDNSEETVDKSANLLATGDSANDILSNDNFDKLLIEIGYVSGFRPTTAAITDFTDFLRLYTFKEDIEVIYKELDSPDEEDLSLNEIFDLEKENRTAYNSGKTLAIYIYFTDAPAEGDEDEEEEDLVTLGAVYQNTSMVIYEATIRNLAARSVLISDADVESTTLNHEFGHLFGLVDLGTTPINSGHEDEEAPNHCNVEGCLMRAELQFGSSRKSLLESASYGDGLKAGCMLSGNTVLSLLQSKSGKSAITPDLDDECVSDIQGNGGR